MLNPFEHPTSEIIDPIDQETIDGVNTRFLSKFGLALSDDQVVITRPGDQLFDYYERDYKQRVLGQKHVELTGQLPGFVLTEGNDRIIFFGIPRELVLEMANKYAEKEGINAKFVTDVESAEFIKMLSVKALLHEATHMAYPQKIDPAFLAAWEKYVDNNPSLRARVIELQKDKYRNVSDIPIAEEALADAMIDVMTEGVIESRLRMPEGVQRLKELLGDRNPFTE